MASSSGGSMEPVPMDSSTTAQTYSPFPWPRYDIDGGRQSPFEDEDDYDYDSCCGPEGSEWKPTSDLVLPTNASSSESNPADIIAASMASTQDQDMGGDSSSMPDSFIVDGVVLNESMLAIRGFKRSGKPPSSPGPASRKPRVQSQGYPQGSDVPFQFGR
eukprot:TRINITY_DN47124_c0_g1_i1.p1 TRINITY_DN47124_c0_g1~~TRINITY_DN47124_c0_g1_i1.p1  ORF type:complete len:173 (-),score=27.65 TRINITY_DN47124_c0_g1_i1:310-789(-)